MGPHFRSLSRNTFTNIIIRIRFIDLAFACWIDFKYKKLESVSELREGICWIWWLDISSSKRRRIRNYSDDNVGDEDEEEQDHVHR